MAKSGVSLDVLDVYGVYGAMEGFASAVQSNGNLSDITKHVAVELGDEFDRFADGWALAHGDMIDHMYEWNMAGASQGRLWNTFNTGAGKNKTVTFTYLPSKTYVPIPEELQEPGPNDQVVSSQHIFKNKAMIMEMGTTVTIVPKNAKALAFLPMRTDKQGNARPTFKQRAILTPGQEVQGNFTGVWMTWWSQLAPEVWEKVIGPKIQKRNADSFTRVVKNNTRKTFAIRNTTPGEGRLRAGVLNKKMQAEITKEVKRLRKK
jgi:hypothetical protein